MAESTGTRTRQPVTIELRGRYTLAEVAALWRTLESATHLLGEGDQVRVDLSGVDHADGAAIALLEHARRDLGRRGVAFALASVPDRLQDLIRIHGGPEEVGKEQPRQEGAGLLWRTGQGTVALGREIRKWLAFVGGLVRTLAGAARQPGSVNWRVVPSLFEQAGADAVPIIAGVDFLIGVVTAYEASLQLRRFGATLYVADLVGASVVRELGPLITAVLVTGRTGAAFAAELGTMSVSEEVDALRAMGIDPMRFLVIPRMLAISMALPLLTLLGDCTGIFGGLLLARLTLGMTAPAYMNETRGMIFAPDIFWGVLKSFAFALAIGSIACQQGLAASGGASGVGRRTTSAVVASVTAVICIDALFAPFFRGHYG